MLFPLAIAVSFFFSSNTIFFFASFLFCIDYEDIIIRNGDRVTSHLNLTELDKIPIKTLGLRNVKSMGDLAQHESIVSIHYLSLTILLLATLLSFFSSHSSFQLTTEDHQSSNMHETFTDTIIYRFNGELTYINSLAHVERLKQINYENTVLSLKHTFYLDLDGLDALEEIIKDLTARGRYHIVYSLSFLILYSFLLFSVIVLF